ncbi:uncharacterized protein PAC_14969 [Phialocephala subalpina]|uniref:Uncharacterized protein n=1 Tax=Phialocephala subalpina TaxID=576137 RepID=A0A1L7XJ49_9HELO|nr:uncharacterized protein PAC_14969 [Phialocephala subalpina]
MSIHAHLKPVNMPQSKKSAGKAKKVKAEPKIKTESPEPSTPSVPQMPYSAGPISMVRLCDDNCGASGVKPEPIDPSLQSSAGITTFVSLCDGKTVYQFTDKDQLFDPTTEPRYANDLGQPYLLLKYNPILQCADQDTVVMIVGGRTMGGYTAAARYFGPKSEHNRNSFVAPETAKPLIDQILAQTCLGCNTLRQLFKDKPKIKKGYIMTSSDALIQGVSNIFEWTKNGFPATLPEGMSQELLGLLRGHLQDFDTRGFEVKFWKVAPEFITGPTFPSENQLLDFFDAPHETDVSTCHCTDCMDRKQYAELKFAKYGMACCPCEFGKLLAKKYGKLKKGDKFVITNNTGVTEATVIMRVDAKGMVFQHASA